MATTDGVNDRVREMAQELYQNLTTDLAAGDAPQSSILLLDAALRQWRTDIIADVLAEEAQAQKHSLPGLPDALAAIREYVAASDAWCNLHYITGNAREAALGPTYQRLQAAWVVLQAIARRDCKEG